MFFSSKTAPPRMWSSLHSTGPSRSIRVMIFLAQASSTAALTEIFASSIQPIMHSTPYTSAAAAIRSALVMPPHFISLMFTRSAAPVCMIFRASAGLNTLSSASTGTSAWRVTYCIPSRSAAGTGCSTNSMSSPLSCIWFRMRTACLAFQAWFASMRMQTSLPTASRTAASRATSSSGSMPTLTFRQSYPRAMAVRASRAISSGGFTLMVMSVTMFFRAPPSIR